MKHDSMAAAGSVKPKDLAYCKHLNCFVRQKGVKLQDSLVITMSYENVG